jgi:hypothetical protein
MPTDPIAASRLGDLPDAGYATMRQRQTSDAIMIFMRQAERNRALLLSIVVDGIEKWRKTAGTVWRGLLIDRDLLDSIFRYFVLQAGPNPAQQLLILNGMAKQQMTTRWDKRTRTQNSLTRELKSALDNLRREQKKH